MATWLRGPLRELFSDTFAGRRELLGLPLDGAALARLLEEHVSGRADLSRALWMILSLALWHDRHFRPGARPTVPAVTVHTAVKIE
jgi:asparagine synthase (glutamine-hydrolysing)